VLPQESNISLNSPVHEQPSRFHPKEAQVSSTTPTLAELAPVRRGTPRRTWDHCCDLVRRVWPSVWFSAKHQSGEIQRVDGDSQRQLEGGLTHTVGVVLSHGQNVPRRSGRSVRDEAEKADVRRAREGIEPPAGESQLAMQTALLKPDTHLRVRYPVPRNGWVEYTVEADGVPVTTWILDDDGLREFNSGRKDITSYYGGFTHRYKHHQEIRLPFRGWWYLIIENDSRSEPAAVSYEVSG